MWGRLVNTANNYFNNMWSVPTFSQFPRSFYPYGNPFPSPYQTRSRPASTSLSTYSSSSSSPSSSSSSSSGDVWESGIRVPGFPYRYSGSTGSPDVDSSESETTTTTSPTTTAYRYTYNQETTPAALFPTLIPSLQELKIVNAVENSRTGEVERFYNVIQNRVYPYQNVYLTTTRAPLLPYAKSLNSENEYDEAISIVPTAEDEKFQRFLTTTNNEKLTTEGKKRKSSTDGTWESMLVDHDTGDFSDSVIMKPPPLPDLVEMKQPEDEGFRRLRLRKW
ncbi:unnamed protein product [Enterobius vermicularis]|uniref:Uncharacterized protein n=1 Tax=Enterobius vermicularis TaxID=51028 RepID=A0A0N4VCL7_ENTVE|nr:unnamed protein product [Enterobius vermicularis]